MNITEFRAYGDVNGLSYDEIFHCKPLKIYTMEKSFVGEAKLEEMAQFFNEVNFLINDEFIIKCEKIFNKKGEYYFITY